MPAENLKTLRLQDNPPFLSAVFAMFNWKFSIVLSVFTMAKCLPQNC